MDQNGEFVSPGGGVSAELTDDQSRLVQEKVTVLREARDLQTKLAKAREELTRIDEEMLRAKFKLPVLPCW